MSKRLVGGFLTVFMCMCCVVFAFAEESEMPASSGIITHVLEFRMVNKTYVSQIPEVLLYLETEWNYTYAIIDRDGTAGSIYGEQISLRWHLDEPPTGAGPFAFTADVIPPDGCVFAEGVPQQLTLNYIFYDDPLPEERYTVKNILLSRGVNDSVLIRQGDEDEFADFLEMRTDLLQVIKAETGDPLGSVYLVLDEVESDVLLDTLGCYEMRYKFTLSPEDAELYTLPDEIRTVKFLVYVYDPDVLTIELENYSINWVFVMTSEEMDDTALIEFLPGGDEMLSNEALSDADWQPLVDFRMGYKYFSISREISTQMKSMYVRLTWGDKQSNILYIEDDGHVVRFDDIGGDRDGGDGSGTKPPILEQDPPSGDDNDNNDNGNSDDIGNGGRNDETDNYPPTWNQSGNRDNNSDTIKTPVVTTDQKSGDISINVMSLFEPTQQGDKTDSETNSADNALIISELPIIDDKSTSVGDTPKPETTQNEGGQTETQSTVKPTSEPQQETHFKESFGETQDIISGTRLLMMLSDMGTARFSKQGVTVTLSANTLNQLNIKDADRFSITIERIGDTEIYFFVELNDIPMTKLPGSVIMIPLHMQNDNSSLLLIDERGESYEGSYDTSISVATFTVDESGYYTIKEQTPTIENTVTQTFNDSVDTAISILPAAPTKAPTSESKTMNMPFAVVALILTATGAGGWLWRKRRFKV